MRRVFLWSLSGLAGCLLLSTAVQAAGGGGAAYPLRVHIFQRDSHSHYYRGQSLDYVDGEGRANLYENGEPHGFDFSYRCGERLMVSAGYETYFARWKKPGKTLELLLPVMGKPGAADACELQVEMKNAAYYRHNGAVDEEPEATFKDWMDRHQYDPENGKNDPVPVAPAPTGSGAASAAAPGTAANPTQ
jgi:hypothetical protein